MTEVNIENLMREYFKAEEQGDVEKALTFWTEDGIWVSPFGTFKGKEEIKHYLTWLAKSIQDKTITDTGIGIMVQGNKAFGEHIMGGKMAGVSGEVLVMGSWEFSNGKIKRMTVVLDRMMIAKQIAQGWLPKKIINSIIKKLEKGLN